MMRLRPARSRRLRHQPADLVGTGAISGPDRKARGRFLRRSRGKGRARPRGISFILTLEVSMKLVKSLLLGSAAGLVAIGGAHAADLPTRKAAPVDYVRICSVYGPGFFYIPGTDTCLKIGGKAEFDLEWRSE